MLEISGPDIMANNENSNNEEINTNGDSELDWSTDTLMHHPDGMEKALQDNISKMEAATRDIIENGSIEEIEAALEENMQQLAALQQHMEKLTQIEI